jgi:hypothetical protein
MNKYGPRLAPEMLRQITIGINKKGASVETPLFRSLLFHRKASHSEPHEVVQAIVTWAVAGWPL